MWIVYALLAAVFSALTAILSKIGLAGINSHLATAIRTTFVMLITWLLVWGLGIKTDDLLANRKQLLFLALSAMATGGAWVCYNRALQLGPTTRVAAVDKLSLVLVAILSAVIFKENMGWSSLVGVALIAAGTLVLVLL